MNSVSQSESVLSKYAIFELIIALELPFILFGQTAVDFIFWYENRDGLNLWFGVFSRQIFSIYEQSVTRGLGLLPN
jgi:hypothetical protein